MVIRTPSSVRQSLALLRDPREVSRPGTRRGTKDSRPSRRHGQAGIRCMPRTQWSQDLLRSATTGWTSNKKKVAERHVLHVSATQETERSDRRMAAQVVRFLTFLTVRRRSPTACANHVETPGRPPLSSPSDVFPAWARRKAPHSRHLVHSTTLQVTVVCGILRAANIPRACWLKIEHPGKPSFQPSSRRLLAAPDAGISCGRIAKVTSPPLSPQARILQAGPCQDVPLAASRLKHPYLHPCAAHAMAPADKPTMSSIWVCHGRE